MHRWHCRRTARWEQGRPDTEQWWSACRWCNSWRWKQHFISTDIQLISSRPDKRTVFVSMFLNVLQFSGVLCFALRLVTEKSWWAERGEARQSPCEAIPVSESVVERAAGSHWLKVKHSPANGRQRQSRPEHGQNPDEGADSSRCAPKHLLLWKQTPLLIYQLNPLKQTGENLNARLH